jgi:2,4-dienoyl-CoA reductase-like NADH-dependent reductase (Old Yellow Enzyme family)/thioredoxin reductase
MRDTSADLSKPFPSLFSDIAIGNCRLRNRIVSTGHHTYLADRQPGDALIAYHEARARGGVGLIITEIVAVHETAGFSSDLLTVNQPGCIDAYRRLVDRCHKYGAKIFAQLFHPGREILSSASGMLPVAWAPSAVPNERFHIMPKAMPVALVQEIIESFGTTAGVLVDAGFDGVEIVASHGYLPSQFLNPHTNLRTDDYGGSDINRRRFLTETIESIKQHAGKLAVGLRISGDEFDDTGLDDSIVQACCVALAPQLDYLNITAGTSASLGASVHITPPMGVAHAYVADCAKRIKQQVDIPVIVTGRINQPQIAEQVIARGDADLCGMTRALICDPQMPNKADSGNTEAIRACIGCNQACIGRAHKGHGISCIQYPESGRETRFASLPAVSQRKKVLVAGGGPAGMKAAAIAAQRGHDVTLCEAAGRLGGQALLAQQLPGREEFGGIVDNLSYELTQAGVTVKTGCKVGGRYIETVKPDVLINATGAVEYLPAFEGRELIDTHNNHIVTAWAVLNNTAQPGSRVVIADWRADWTGVGLAEKLACDGCEVTLCTNAALVGETLQLYTRNHYVGRLHKLGVNVQTHARFYGADENTVWFQDTLTQAPVVFEAVDTLVLSLGHLPNGVLETQIDLTGIEYYAIGDCESPRTAEEAVYEGLLTGIKI